MGARRPRAGPHVDVRDTGAGRGGHHPIFEAGGAHEDQDLGRRRGGDHTAMEILRDGALPHARKPAGSNSLTQGPQCAAEQGSTSRASCSRADSAFRPTCGRVPSACGARSSRRATTDSDADEEIRRIVTSKHRRHSGSCSPTTTSSSGRQQGRSEDPSGIPLVRNARSRASSACAGAEARLVPDHTLSDPFPSLRCQAAPSALAAAAPSDSPSTIGRRISSASQNALGAGLLEGLRECGDRAWCVA